MFFLPTPEWSQVAYILLRFNGNLPVKSTMGKSTTWSFRFRPSASPESAQGKAKGKAGEEDNDLDLDAAGNLSIDGFVWFWWFRIAKNSLAKVFFYFFSPKKKAGW